MKQLEFDFGDESRVDIIGQNGNTGKHYLIEEVAKAICGWGSEMPLHGKRKGQKRWELHKDQAKRVLIKLEQMGYEL